MGEINSTDGSVKGKDDENILMVRKSFGSVSAMKGVTTKKLGVLYNFGRLGRQTVRVFEIFEFHRPWYSVVHIKAASLTKKSENWLGPR